MLLCSRRALVAGMLSGHLLNRVSTPCRSFSIGARWQQCCTKNGCYCCHISWFFMQAKRRLGEFLQSLPLLSRWNPGEDPMYHRHLGLQWHDMCAESLGMSKVALLFLTRGPVHQASSCSPPLLVIHIILKGQACQKPKCDEAITVYMTGVRHICLAACVF